LCFTHGFFLKSFLEHCVRFNCSFSQKETKLLTHSLYFKIRHFNFKKTAKHTCQHLYPSYTHILVV
jgi:hypothetical protein